MNQTPHYLLELRKIIWPIEWHESKKFLPMAAMMFCILFNYAILRSVKDGFVVTAIGPEAIGFLKTYIVLPAAILAMIIYTKLCNAMSQQKVFYVITSFFIVYIAIFAFILYPEPDKFNLDPETIVRLSEQYPNFKWFIRIIGYWSFASFYAISELWGSLMLSLLFWQFANQITKTEEAKRFYSMFGLLGNAALPLASLVIGYFLSENVHIVAEKFRFIPVLMIVIVSAATVMFLYAWINANVLTDPTLYTPASGKVKKAKVKLSIGESLKMIFSSKYLGLIAILVLSYGVSINLVEGVWKAKVKQLYPTKEAYTMFMGEFQAWQGFAAIIFMVVGSNILRRVSWGTAAILTPLMILITGVAFFAFIFFDNVIAMHLTGLLSSGPLVVAVVIGMIQNVLSKATKYSLFDSTKEMAYIPLDDELKTKGKAAVDVVGGRFGKSGGGIIQSTFFALLPAWGFAEATPYFAGIFLIIVILWLYGIRALNKEYHKQMIDHSY
ncbi:Npt1/Npt2 family nucleotide transporter [Candidatus Trichorickettsia mobilis]|uniref:Npt1/Npt2 family nucleotide transporter n=1 Tax=Candidatus Trichorickettsia mobilis TaxID=1346319 RepID=UPI002931215A|nr:Npt1/Npt2 family nucleotide transporter [Candidatus Trichorickettsia mobilis]